MFQDTSAWFSSSADRKYIDLWIKQGGIVVDTYKADKLPEYLFSCDLEENDTQRIIKHISYMVLHPDWIIDSITENIQKPIEQYILQNYYSHDTNIDKIADNKSNKINSNRSIDILTDLADHNQTNEDYIVAHSLTIPNEYCLPLKRARKVSKGKNPVQGNDEQQSKTTDIMSIQSDDASQDLEIIDMQIDSESEGNGRSTINNSNEDLSGDPTRNKRDRPRTLPDFMSRKRPKVVLTSTSEDDSFFSDEDSNQKRNRTNYTQKSIRTSSVGKKSPSIRCECGRSVQSTTPAKKLLVKRLKDPPQTINKSIASIRLQHISIQNLLEKVSKYLRVVKGPNSTLMDDVYEFTPGQDGFSAQLKSTATTSVNPRVQTRGKSSSRKPNS